MIQHRFIGGLLIVAMASACVVAACSSDESPTPAGGGSTSSGGTSGGSTSGTRVSAAAGGTVADPSGKTSLDIPPGALAQDTDITLAILPKSGAALVEVSDFGPDGLTFLKPATLSIKGEAALAPSGKLALAVDEGAGFKELPGSTYANGAASAPIMHFSKYTLIAADGSPGVDAGPDTGGGGDPAPGTSSVEATFSNPIESYNGLTTAYSGAGSAEVKVASLLVFRTTNGASQTGPTTLRILQVNVNTETPVQGMTYTTAAYDAPGGIGYTEYGGGNPQKNWACEGALTFDTVAGKLYKFHFTATCKYPGTPFNPDKAVGAVTINGTGSGLLK